MSEHKMNRWHRDHGLFFSDNLALWGVGIIREQEVPQMHQIISKLCASANLLKPKIAIAFIW